MTSYIQKKLRSNLATKSLDKSEQYLKENISFESLDQIAYAKSDTEFAYTMNQEKQKAYKKLKF